MTSVRNNLANLQAASQLFVPSNEQLAAVIQILKTQEITDSNRVDDWAGDLLEALQDGNLRLLRVWATGIEDTYLRDRR